MTQYQAFDKDVEVNGQTVLTIVKGMEFYEIQALQILEENGIHNPKPSEWYSQQSWLDAFRKISMEIGPHALYNIGKKIPENAQFPSNIDALEKAMESIDIAYHMNHRGGEIGNYEYYQASDNSMYFICTNPYPCEFDRGIIEGMARRFTPEGRHLIVKHDDSEPCRDKGGATCTYHIVLSDSK